MSVLAAPKPLPAWPVNALIGFADEAVPNAPPNVPGANEAGEKAAPVNDEPVIAEKAGVKPDIAPIGDPNDIPG